jgi:hypothetical protein
MHTASTPGLKTKYRWPSITGLEYVTQSVADKGAFKGALVFLKSERVEKMRFAQVVGVTGMLAT